MENLRDKIILVTGGTGFVGKALCALLVRLGARVFVLTRSNKRLFDTSLTRITDLAELGANVPEIIINLAGEPIAQRWTAAAKDRILRSRLDTTAALIDYIQSAPAKPTLLISASAIGFYGTDPNTVFDESIAPSAGAPFSRTLCAAWEQEARKAESYGVRTVLLRIGAVLGHDGGMLGKLLPPFRLGLGGPIGDGAQILSWIDRDDLLQLILHIIATPAIMGPINATAPEPVSNQIFAETLAAVLHRPCAVRTPGLVLRLAFADMADEIMLAGQKVLPRKALANGFVFTYPTLHLSLQKIFKEV